MDENLCILHSDNEMVDIIQYHIDNFIPLDISRLGDGEYAFLKNINYHDVFQKFCKNWGFSFPKEAKKAKKTYLEILIKVLNEGSFVGMMKSGEIHKEHISTISFDELKRLGVRSPKAIQTFNLEMIMCKLGSIEDLALIFKGNPVHIMSCRTKELQQNGIDKKLGCHVTYTQVDRSLRWNETTRNDIFTKADSIKEFIVIVSLGPIGKDVPIYLKNRGKCCIDFGAVIDAWASIPSRKYFKEGNRHSRCFIKKSKV